MQYILTNIKNPIPVQEFDGEITLLQAKFWPAWQIPKFNTIFSYERGGKKYVVPVVMGKSYTLVDIQLLVNEHLNVSEQVALLIYNNGRITWRVYPNTQTTRVELSTGIKELLNIATSKPYDGGTITGQPVSESSIRFTYSNARTLFLECAQINDTCVDGKLKKTLCVIPVTAGLDASITANLYHPVIAAYRENFAKELTFKIRDEHGNDLPIKQALVRFIINDECVSRKNLP